MSGFHGVVFDTSTLVGAALRVGSIPHQALKQAFSQGEVFGRRQQTYAKPLNNGVNWCARANAFRWQSSTQLLFQRNGVDQ